MLTKTQKLLQLLRSDRVDNRLLAIELMQSLHLQKQVAALVNHHSLFRFLEAAHVTPDFFYYRGILRHASINNTLKGLCEMLIQSEVPTVTRRKICHLLSDLALICQAKPAFERHTRVVGEYTKQGIDIGISWYIDPAMTDHLQQQFRVIDELVQDKERLLDCNEYIVEATKHNLGTVNTKALADIACQLYKRCYQYKCTPLNEEAMVFSLLVKFRI